MESTVISASSGLPGTSSQSTTQHTNAAEVQPIDLSEKSTTGSSFNVKMTSSPTSMYGDESRSPLLSAADRPPSPAESVASSVSSMCGTGSDVTTSPGGGYLSGGGGRVPNQVGTVRLRGVQIVSLVIDGKERLCLAQISNTLLKSFSYNEIHNRRVALGITCVQCTPVQLEILRRYGAMPISSRRCGMITKREAERLVTSFLEQHSPPKLPDTFAFDVVHSCGWGCRGSFVPSRYNSSRAKCIRCAYCQLYLSPNKFIFHFHRVPNSHYHHPDAANFNSWRRHLTLDYADPPDELVHAWEDVKAMFNGGSRKRLSSPSGHGAGGGHSKSGRGASASSLADAAERQLNDEPRKRQRLSCANTENTSTAVSCGSRLNPSNGSPRSIQQLPIVAAPPYNVPPRPASICLPFAYHPNQHNSGLQVGGQRAPFLPLPAPPTHPPQTPYPLPPAYYDAVRMQMLAAADLWKSRAAVAAVANVPTGVMPPVSPAFGMFWSKNAAVFGGVAAAAAAAAVAAGYPGFSSPPPRPSTSNPTSRSSSLEELLHLQHQSSLLVAASDVKVFGTSTASVAELNSPEIVKHRGPFSAFRFVGERLVSPSPSVHNDTDPHVDVTTADDDDVSNDVRSDKVFDNNANKYDVIGEPEISASRKDEIQESEFMKGIEDDEKSRNVATTSLPWQHWPRYLESVNNAHQQSCSDYHSGRVTMEDSR